MSVGGEHTAAVQPRMALPSENPGFRDYVTARSGSLLRMAYLLTRNLADAEDLVQAALAKTYQAWDRIEDRNALDGYVRRAMVNTHISWWRQRRLEEYPTEEIPDRPVPWGSSARPARSGRRATRGCPALLVRKGRRARPARHVGAGL